MVLIVAAESAVGLATQIVPAWSSNTETTRSLGTPSSEENVRNLPFWYTVRAPGLSAIQSLFSRSVSRNESGFPLKRSLATGLSVPFCSLNKPW